MTERGAIERAGCRLAYATRGAGPPVLLIQGVGVHGDGWLPQVDALAAHHRCLWFDNRGMTASQPVGSAPFTVATFAADALALVETQGWSNVHVIGHSLGGLIALELALAARERVRILSLVCTFARGAAAGSSAHMMWLGTRSRVGTRRMRRRAFLQIVYPPEVLAATDRDALAARLAPLFGHDLADHAPIEMKQLGAMRNHDVTRRLGELASLPTLVVSARHDPIAPPALGHAIADGIPGARFVVLDGASHGAPIQDPARVNALLLDHLAAS